MSACPDGDRLRMLEAGELPEDEVDRLWTHIGSCHRCIESLEHFRRDDFDGRVLRAALGRETTLTATSELNVSPGGTTATKTPIWNIPDYERVRLCGEGAYGTVWAVRDRVGMHRALKVIDLERLGEANVQCRESTALEAYCRRVDPHPNLIQIYHVGMQGTLLYYTMELADDDISRKPVRDDFPLDYRPLTLQRVVELGRVRADTAIEVVIRLLRGLARLHAVGMAHRDIKPANIVFVGREPKLADIGMITTNTATPSSVGTPAYMPPDGKMDLTGDTFALGKTICDLLMGEDQSSFPRIDTAVLDMSDHWNSEKVNNVIAKACAADAHQRYRHAEQMLDAIEGCRELAYEALFDDLGTLSKPPPRAPRSPAVPVMIAAVHTLPWLLLLILIIILVQKFL